MSYNKIIPIEATGGPTIELTSKITIKARKVHTVSPNATWFKCFELLVIISALLSTLFVTFQIYFKADVGEFIVLTYIFDLVYVIHGMCSFNERMAYTRSKIICIICRGVFDRHLIKRRYLRTKFIFDITLSVKKKSAESV